MIGTHNLAIRYYPNDKFEMVSYTDFDWASLVDDEKSTSDFFFSLGYGFVSLSSKKQVNLALSSLEGEHMEVVATSCQAIQILEDLYLVQEHPKTIFGDNSSTIVMVENLLFHGRSKDLEIHHPFIQDLVHNGIVELQFCPNFEQVADIFT